MLQGRRASQALLLRCRVYLQQVCNNSNKVSNKRRAPTSVVLREVCYAVYLEACVVLPSTRCKLCKLT